MAKIKYDVRGVERSREFDTPIPVGVYKMVVSNAVKKKSKSSGNDMLELELEVPKGEHKGRKVWEYIVLDENSDWKVAQLIDALGMKEKGTLDTDKLIGKSVKVRVKHETWETTNDEGEEELQVMSKVGSLLKPKDEAEEEETEEEEEEEESEEDEEADDDAEEESEEEEEAEEEEEDEEESDDDSLTWDELSEYDRAALKEFKKVNEAETKITKGKSDDDIRRELAEEFGIEVPDSEEAEEEEEESEEEEDDYSDWSLKDLKKECKSRDLKTNGTKGARVKRLEKDDKGDKKKKSGEPF